MQRTYEIIVHNNKVSYQIKVHELIMWDLDGLRIFSLQLMLEWNVLVTKLRLNISWSLKLNF